MDWVDWMPAVTSTGLLALAGLLFGPKIINALVERSAQHILDRKLEALRSTLRREEEELRADLQRYEEQLTSLRSGALGSLASRRVAIDKRRLEATEKVWATVVDMGKLKPLATMMSMLNVEGAANKASGNSQDALSMRRFAETILATAGFQKPEDFKPVGISAAKERPFITPLAWAMYAAYETIFTNSIAQAAIIRAGMSAEMLADPRAVRELLKKAMPDQADLVDKGALLHLPC